MLLVRAIAPTFTRPSNTTQYAAGDLVANSVTAGSVTNRVFTFKRSDFQSHSFLKIRRAILQKTDNDVTSAAFLLHLFTSAPTYATNGDNDLVSGNTTTTEDSYLGTLTMAAMHAFATHARGIAVPTPLGGGEFLFWRPNWSNTEEQSLYGVMAANGTYTPASAGTFRWELEGEAV